MFLDSLKVRIKNIKQMPSAWHSKVLHLGLAQHAGHWYTVLEAYMLLLDYCSHCPLSWLKSSPLSAFPGNSSPMSQRLGPD